MKKIPAVILACLMFAGRPITANEFQPSDYYTAAFTFLGSAGGAVLGTSIAGLSRPTGSSTVRPFMQWGAVGALVGGTLGRDIAQFSLETDTDLPGPKPVSTREANACLGALGGQLAGYAVIAIIDQRISRNDRTIWASVALGTLLGSAIGYFLPPIQLITIPPEQSRKDRTHEDRITRLEPLIPLGNEAKGVMTGAESIPVESLPPARPFLPASKLTKLDHMLMTPENNRLMDSYQPVFPRESPASVKPLVSPMAKTGESNSAPAAQLTALAGFCIGASGGASMGGSRTEMLTRLGVCGAGGLVGGWALAHSTLNPARAISNEELEDTGNLFSMSSAWTIAGTMLGIGSGAVFRNNFKDFGITDAARVTFGFACLGMGGGAISAKF